MTNLLYGCLRCPQCHQLPVLMPTGSIEYPHALLCEKHGHEVCGRSPDECVPTKIRKGMANGYPGD